MAEESIGNWVEAWSRRYPVEYDRDLVGVRGQAHLSRDDLEKVYTWKFKGLWPARKVRAMRAVPEHEIAGLTARAFRCDDELGALLILMLIPGLQAAGASAVLMAQDPDRYTVMDVRALRSLAALGRWSADERGTEATAQEWPEYLDTCRRLQEETGHPLRVIDRALWAADGSPDLPAAGRS